jgi:hypothetical protein
LRREKRNFALGSWSQDQDCIDVTVAAAGIPNGGFLADPKVDLQLKATNSVNFIRGDHVALQLRRPQYERLTIRSFAEKVLVVLVLPPDPAEWVTVTAERLVLRKPMAGLGSIRGALTSLGMCGKRPRETSSPSCCSTSRSVTISVAWASWLRPSAGLRRARSSKSSTTC